MFQEYDRWIYAFYDSEKSINSVNYVEAKINVSQTMLKNTMFT